MKTIVVYHSLYGNTEIIARAIAGTIPGEVQLLRVDQVQPGQLEAADLLIIGAPTHGSLPSEAAQALLKQVGPPARPGARLATFDTRLSWKFLQRYGYAASKMADALVQKGWTLVGEPAGFFVKGLKKGPLKKGEAERAAAWAKTVVEDPS
jgi:flavodoxin I